MVIYYLCIAVLSFIIGCVCQYKLPNGITPLDILFIFVLSILWFITLFSAVVIGIVKICIWLSKNEFMNKRLF